MQSYLFVTRQSKTSKIVLLVINIRAIVHSQPAKAAMMNVLLAALMTASLFSFASSANVSDVCSSISNPSCRCSQPPSSTSFANIRCTFNASQSPSPLFANASFAGSVTLDTLDLSENDLDDLPDDFFHLETIHTLILRENRFEVVPGALKKLRTVKSVDLSFNGLKSLSWEVLADVEGLERLDVSDNMLTALSGDPEVVGKIGKLRQLQELSVARNAIASLNNDTLGLLTSLTTLDLAHNQLSQVTQITFWPLRLSLHSLDLSNNSLTRVDPLAFQPLEEIRELSLAHNNLEEVLGKVWFPQHVTNLDLRKCGIISVNRCRLSALTDLTALDLRGNPFNCTCELFHLHQRFQSPGSNDSQWSCQTLPGSAQTAVADLGGQCRDHYTVCPSVSKMVDQMVMSVDMDASGDSILVSWTLDISDDLQIDGFQVRYVPETGDPLTSDLLPSDRRRLTMDTPGLAEHFRVCFDVLMYTSAVVRQECQNFKEGAGSSVLVGILAGVVFLLPCAIILTYIFIKDNRIAKALYEKVDVEGDDVEKGGPGNGSVVVSISPGDAEKIVQDKRAELPNSNKTSDDDNASSAAGVVTVQSIVVTEADGPRTPESTNERTPPLARMGQATGDHDGVVVSVEQLGSQDPTPTTNTEGIGNLAFRCEGGGHEGVDACPDPQHVSTDL